MSPRGTPAREVLREAMTEREWMDAVVQVAQLFHWRIFHCHDARRSQPGLPDLILCRPPRVLFIELKTTRGRLSVAQQEWLGDLAACSQIEAGLFRPTDEDELFALLKPRSAVG